MHNVRLPTAEPLTDLPFDSILGINYNGGHDSAIAIVSAEGVPLLAVSLERISRVKQDGRPLRDLLMALPWEKIRTAAISAPESLGVEPQGASRLLSIALPHSRPTRGLTHAKGFHDAIADIPCNKMYVGHQEAHAAAAFWGSGFDECLCLTYDGGMFNEYWFGGLYRCSKTAGIVPLDRFNTLRYAKITTLYTFVTALLGFAPLRHEGKLTGLAAYGKPTTQCEALLRKWFEEYYYEIEKTLRWVGLYDERDPPTLRPASENMKKFEAQIVGMPPEEISATLQAFSETHVTEILLKAKSSGWDHKHICLSGGLFANVKINGVVANCGFDEIFVAPAMTDDGTALGAAWVAASCSDRFRPQPLQSVFLGPAYSEANMMEGITNAGVAFSRPTDPARAIAELLAQGLTVAVFQGAAEFGPRALGNRSILAAATDKDVNRRLNERLLRTEFMPFAPVTQIEDAEACYVGIEHVRRAAEFMTVTVHCTDLLKKTCPAVVHIDGTARPQLVNSATNPFIHQVLAHYKDLTGVFALVNTSFNGHEEPIVCSVEDALRCFFRHRLDYLYFGGGILIAYAGNERAASKYAQNTIIQA